MTPLRQRYSDDLRVRNKSPRTSETYVLRVRQFAEHFGKSPEQLGPDELCAYQQHLVARPVSWSMFNQSVCALRFLYNVTLRRPHLIEHLPFAKRPRLLPTVLSPEEVVQLLAAALPGATVRYLIASLDRRSLARRPGQSVQAPTKTPEELAAAERARRYLEMEQSEDEGIWWPMG